MSERGPALPDGSQPPRSRRALRALGVLALVLAVFAAGYVLELGPFDERELTRSELIAEADTICETARDAFVDLQSRPLQTAEQQATLTGRLLGIARDESAELGALDGPSEVEEQVAGYLRARERGIALMERGLQAAERGDESAYERAQDEVAETQAERTELARSIGFGSCSEPIGSGGELAQQAREPTAN